MGKQPLLCPVCGFEYVHPVKVSVNAGGATTEIDSEGTRLGADEPAGRGVTIALEFVCEEGHRFLTTFQFHKGQTETETHHTGDIGMDDPDFPKTIWRD